MSVKRHLANLNKLPKYLYYHTKNGAVLIIICGLAFVVMSCSEANQNSNEHSSKGKSDETESSLEEPSAIAKLLSPIPLGWDEDEFDEIEEFENSQWQDSVFSKNEVNFISSNGDSYQIKFKCYTREAPNTIGEILAQPGCIYSIAEKSIINSIINITAFRNKKRYFSQDIYKNEFNGILSKEFLKNHQLVGADLFTFNERFQQCIFRLNLAQRMGGTEWFGQVYYVVDKNGKTEQENRPR